MGEFLACDWGSTNLRAWRLDDEGRILDRRDFALGVARLGPGQAERRFKDEVRPVMGAEDLPALLCGMVGSTLGWTVVPYRDCPIDLQGLHEGLVTVERGAAPVHLVPGLRGPGLDGAPEVMRGEETQVFGWMVEAPERLGGRWIVCHPGTHAKWVVIEDGRLVRFLTAMTGELFDLLRRYSVLRSDFPAGDEAVFLQGVDAAKEGDALSARLFTVRSRVVADGLSAQAAPSYLSGLLIGSEIANLPRLLGVERGEPVALVGDPELCGWYAKAMQARGMATTLHDGDVAAVTGLIALWKGNR
jgi:2-dehydro-3-deoxygalactonokinase